MYGAELVVRLVVDEPPLEVRLHIRVGRELIAGQALPLGVERDELLRHVLHGGADACFRPRPVAGAELVQADLRARLLVRAYVFGDHVELGDGDEQYVLAGVEYLYVVLRHAVEEHRLDAVEHADAVLGVNDVVAARQLVYGMDAVFRLLYLLCQRGLLFASFGASGGDDVDLFTGVAHAVVEASRQHADRPDREFPGYRLEKHGSEAVVREVLVQIRRRLWRAGQDDGREAALRVGSYVGLKHRQRALPRGVLTRVHVDELLHGGVERAAHEVVEIYRAAPLVFARELGERHVEAVEPLAESARLNEYLHVLLAELSLVGEPRLDVRRVAHEKKPAGAVVEHRGLVLVYYRQVFVVVSGTARLLDEIGLAY